MESSPARWSIDENTRQRCLFLGIHQPRSQLWQGVQNVLSQRGPAASGGHGVRGGRQEKTGV